jgi:hypothetical protein
VNKKIAIASIFASLLILPAVAFALPLTPPALPGTVSNLWVVIIAILNFLWPIFIGVSIIMFLFSGFMFVTALGEPGKIKLARESAIYGIVGIVVAILAFSIPYVIGNTLIV